MSEDFFHFNCLYSLYTVLLHNGIFIHIYVDYSFIYILHVAESRLPWQSWIAVTDMDLPQS